jgi:diaminohydroxyphosphoribosylaminopyrimidine deaminase/5-amino-6-(5-phosphoribosylamino)uracil reductase
VHELRAASDAVAVGMGTVRADAPRLDARDVPVARQPRRLAFGRGPLPADSGLELRPGALPDELAALAADGVQSLLLEGGPMFATAFLEAGLVDKLLVFIAPLLSGDGPRFLGDLSASRQLLHASTRPIGDDLLIEAYLREP